MRTWIKHYYGLLVLLPIIVLVVFSNINPTQYFAGWDNFSTSLNVFTNLPRTIFATWRAYRGLGAPSDSEVVDVSRQLFYLTFSWLPIQLIDQTYVFFTLTVGILGVYFLIRMITQDYNRKSVLSSNIAALTGSLLFLFSLNTIATYFFPMPMFIARFAYFPWVIYILIDYLQKSSRKKLAAFALVSFVATSAYLTATVFVTLAVILGFMSLFHLKQLKDVAVLGLVFLLANTFWLLPFFDYSSRKSNLLPLASVFADVNENQLNEALNHFDWPYLTSTYPNFLHIDSATNSLSGEPISLHPKTNKLNPMQSDNWPLMALTIAGLVGSILALFSKKLPFARFIPLLIILNLFMLRKEFPPLGNLYDWLGENIPYFKIVFRFGDTKFNSLLALFASLGIGVSVYWLLERFKSKANKIVVIIPVILLNVVVSNHFWFITTGELVSTLAHTHIPPAYFEIAQAINQDPIDGRVLHLPNDKLSYFKAHSWGYFGSTFMAFLLDKPLMDRAFAPASPENDSIDLKLFELAQNFSNLQDQSSKTQRIGQLQRLLAATNIRYLIHDQTVSIENSEDNITLWGQFMQEDFNALITAATQAKVLEPINAYTVNAPEPSNTITLYQVTTPNLATQTITQAQAIDTQQDNILSVALNNYQPLYQSQANPGNFYPFAQPSLLFSDTSNALEALLKQPIADGTITLELTPNTTHNFRVYVSNTDTDLLITLDHQPYPFPTVSQPASYTLSVPLDQIAPYLQTSATLTNYASDWHTLPYQNVSSVRLGVDETVIPLPIEITNTQQYLATVTTDTPPFNLVLLVPDQTTQLNNSAFTYTDDPNCFQDKGELYANSFEKQTDQITLTTTNGSTCITRHLPSVANNPYLEVSLDYQLTAIDLDQVKAIKPPTFAHQQLIENTSQLPTANYFSACLIHADSNHCLNNHNTFNNQATNLTIITSRLTSAPPQLFISLPTIGTQSATLTLGSMLQTTYKPLDQTTIELNLNYPSLRLTEPLTSITLPKSLSPESYYFNPRLDALRAYNQPCSEADEYRAVKQNQSGSTLLYTHNCSSGAYIIMPFNSDHLYLWQTDYHLYSGKFPTFSLASSDNTYLQRYLSWNQGYPNIDGFRNLQLADPPASIAHNYPNYINTELNQSTYQPTSAYVYPQPGLKEAGTRSWTISQNSQNQGLVGINNFNITQLPTNWQNMSISQNIAQTVFRLATVKQTKAVLPSLWRIDLAVDQPSKFNLGDDPTPTTNQVFLHFSQAYDDKWQLYRTNQPLLVILGVGKVKADHVKVNGLTNGWIFTPTQNQATYYALYTPERLTIVGWILTLTTLGYLSVRSFTKPKLKRDQNHDTR